MKPLKVALIVLAVAFAAAALSAQTKDNGLSAFSNDAGPILMAVDAQLAGRAIDSPYSMFVLFMGVKDKTGSVDVASKDVVMVYKGQEYHMPSLTELRDNYRGELRDLGLYRRLGKEGLVASWVRFYDFPERANFFPPLTLRAPLPIDEGHMSAWYGFVTPLYFKNPGFAKGDRLTIKVRDAKNPSLTGECEVVL
ncbi:MAG TPA: hypothetical protein VLN41_01000 [Candidatus Bathyarchaeia archaeon]|nr:hypothetical protein [Candidatus Bathyarchaeia archaeon]